MTKSQNCEYVYVNKPSQAKYIQVRKNPVRTWPLKPQNAKGCWVNWLALLGDALLPIQRDLTHFLEPLENLLLFLAQRIHLRSNDQLKILILRLWISPNHPFILSVSWCCDSPHSGAHDGF